MLLVGTEVGEGWVTEAGEWVGKMIGRSVLEGKMMLSAETNLSTGKTKRISSSCVGCEREEEEEFVGVKEVGRDGEGEERGEVESDDGGWENDEEESGDGGENDKEETEDGVDEEAGTEGDKTDRKRDVGVTKDGGEAAGAGRTGEDDNVEEEGKETLDLPVSDVMDSSNSSLLQMTSSWWCWRCPWGNCG